MNGARMTKARGKGPRVLAPTDDAAPLDLDAPAPVAVADVSVESPVVRDREGGPLVHPARPGVTFKLPRFEGPLDLLDRKSVV